ncbi:MAG: PhzF family phenazine biosynthesis protein [Planctomycetales bacterium]|nr:PhzF family phenazine biosynthesis protein [Planctomycetales bacterium]
MQLAIIDAFAERAFQGNPAAVCLLEREEPATWMQSLASEMNLSETSFVRPVDDGSYEIRWFTPMTEVDLCGHATLATAHFLWTKGQIAGDTLRFQSRSGTLTCYRRNDFIVLDFPATTVAIQTAPPALLTSLGIQQAITTGKSRFDWLIEVAEETELRALQPDFTLLKQVATRGVIVTCRSHHAQFDFMSRFFAPAAGINEDPVTGSAHCCLGPFWGERLNKGEMRAFQASQRGGVIGIQLAGDRVQLSGRAVTVLCGQLQVSSDLS